MKAMLDMLGLSGGPVRPPLVEVPGAERTGLQSILDGWRSVGFLDD